MELKTKNIGENTYKKEVNKTSTSYKKKTKSKLQTPNNLVLTAAHLCHV